MHSNISLEISPSQVESLVEKLPLENKLHLVRRLEKETFASRIDNVADRMRRRIRSAINCSFTHPISNSADYVRRKIFYRLFQRRGGGMSCKL